MRKEQRRIAEKTGSLFDAPEGEILVHAVNCMGVWGAGIALEFKSRFPIAHSSYVEGCSYGRWPGDASLIRGESHPIGLLFTSKKYGKLRDPEEMILKSTKTAIQSLLFLIKEGNVHSNRFNSGFFGIPWEESEKILAEELGKYPDIHWTVHGY